MTVRWGPTGLDASTPPRGAFLRTAAESAAAAAEPVAFEVLPRQECLRILGEQSVGRVAISLHALPAIAPVAYVLLGDELVFGPQAGSGELVAPEGNVVAFQVDDIDPATGTGRNVVTVGVVHPFDRTSADHREALHGGRLPGPVAAAVNLYSLSTQRISGRKWGAAPARA
jgi:hypothetical protein